MIEQDEDQIGRILRRLLPRQKAKSAGSGCPHDEKLAEYLSKLLSEAESRELESHLAGCILCLDELCAAHAAMQTSRESTVPPRVLEKAMALIPTTRAGSYVLELVLRFVRDSLEIVTTTGDLVPAAAPAGIRGKGPVAENRILQVKKELNDLTVAVEVERTEDDLCQLAVSVTATGGGLARGFRFSLFSGEREQASYLARRGSAIFDRIPPGEYRLVVSDSGNALGSIRLTIKEDRHER